MLRIYKSSAGSGKTYTLVKEYLRMCFKAPSNAYRGILAITFTNKAAAEMKERILSALDGLAKSNPDYTKLCNELTELTGKSNDQLRQEAAVILRQMLHHYSDVSVSTIDSFVHRIVRSFTYDLHLPMNFEIEMDSNKLLHEAVTLLLSRLDENEPQITQAVLDFASTKIEAGKGWNIERDIAALGKQLFSDEAVPHLEQLSQIQFEQLQQARASLHARKMCFEKKVSDEGKAAFELLMQHGLTAKDFYQGSRGIFGFFQKYSEGVFPNDVEGNRYVLETIRDDKWGKAQSTEAVTTALRKHYEHIVALWQGEGKDYTLVELLLQNYFSFILLTHLQHLLKELKNENNILHISDFQQKVFEIVKEQDAPVIYERIGERYNNILIDEFQDTSVMQWRNLLPLIENAQFKGEDSLVVGDAKQAIYRFRGGEAAQIVALPKIYGSDTDYLLKEREVAINNYGTETNSLQLNFRSRKTVIDFNNSLYQQLLQLPGLKNKTIYEDYHQKQGKEKPGGFVSIEFLKEGDEETELTINDFRCKRIDEIITHALSRGYRYKDIAILTRLNANASLIASYLIERGIKVVSPESLLIDNSPKVKFLLAAFRYLDRKDDAVARAEMLHYAHLLQQRPADFQSLTADKNYTLFENLLSHALNIRFESNKLSTGRLGDLALELIVTFQLDDKDPFVQFFADELLLYSSRYGNNIGEFLEWWEDVKSKKSIIYPESIDAVKVMTVHKSKGLQFPVVILADASGALKLQKQFFWIDLQKKWLPELHTGILPVKKDVLDTEYAPLYELEEDESFLDMLNLLYVGTTRPEDVLYMLSAEMDKEPAANNSVTALLVAYLKAEEKWDGFRTYFFGSESFVKKHEKDTATYNYYTTDTTNQKVNGTLLPLQVRVTANLLWADDVKNKLEEGKLFHEVLKAVKYEGDEDRILQRLYLRGDLTEDKLNQIKSRIKAVIGHPQLNHFFKQGLNVINERPLLKHGEQTKIPDRVIIQDGEASILDYKTGKERNEHQHQLRAYAKLLEEAGVKVKERIIFYTETQSAVVI